MTLQIAYRHTWGNAMKSLTQDVPRVTESTLRLFAVYGDQFDIEYQVGIGRDT